VYNSVSENVDSEMKDEVRLASSLSVKILPKTIRNRTTLSNPNGTPL
jgi:hypothetical protein